MNKQRIRFCLFLCCFLGFSTVLHAKESGLDSANVLDNLVAKFHNTASHWGGYMLAKGLWLFWGLASLSMTWTFGFMALKQADFQEFFSEAIRFFGVLGFFNWILINAPALSEALITSLRQMAAEASGLPNTLSPSQIVDVGLEIAYKAIDNSSIWSPANTTIGLLVAGIILIVLALVSINLLVVLISGWIIIYGGIFLLGFGGGRWTQDIAINYYRTVLGIALQAFAMVLIVGIGTSFIDQYYAAMSSGTTLKELFVMLVVSIMLLWLVDKIPPMLSGIIHGGGGGSSGFGMGGALGAMGMAAAALSGGASLAAASVMSGAGGGSALSAAFKAASQSLGTESLGPLSGAPQSQSSGALSSAFSKAGNFASSFGSHLASGVSDVLSEKKDAIKESFSARVSETIGGQIAEAIQQNAENESSSDEKQDFDGVLSEGSPTYFDEISQFVNHSNRKEN